jgi:hypothetical protein
MSATALYEPSDGHLVASELTRGPWDPAAQHGGAPAALVMAAFEDLPAADGLALARVTYELLRPVPLGPLELDAEVVRPGGRVQLLEASLRAPGGLDVLRARAVQVRRADAGDLDAVLGRVVPGPEEGLESDFAPTHRPAFATDALEIRFIAGGFGGYAGGGDAVAWFRLRHPVIAGREATPLQRLAAAADFGNGISSPLSWDEYVFINPDLTIYVERQPEGEWICLQSQTRIPAGGVGIAESILYDVHGRVGRATQSLLVARR